MMPPVVWSRLVWVAVGAGLTVYVLAKARSLLKQSSAQALSRRVVGSVAAAREQAVDFAARLRAAMAESEAEIRESLGLPQ